ncbi:MAG: hypothetical protein IJ480_00405 [Clostridia bacterium]|nr:hypothetical protein [Clostridia bacterium]
MADGSVTIAALLDVSAFQASAAALEGQLASLSVRLQNVVTAAVAGSGIDGTLDAVIGTMTGALDGLSNTASQAAVLAAEAAVLSFGSADWSGTGQNAADGLAGGFEGGISRVSGAAEQTAMAVRNAFQGDWYAVGAGIMSGVAAGISGSGGSVVAAMAAVSAQVMASAKSMFQIHSPSAKMRDEVGVMLSRGIAEGILAGSSYIEAALAETGRRTAAPAVGGVTPDSRRFQQNIYLSGSTESPYQTARAIRKQSELMLRT